MELLMGGGGPPSCQNSAWLGLPLKVGLPHVPNSEVSFFAIPHPVQGRAGGTSGRARGQRISRVYVDEGGLSIRCSTSSSGPHP